MEELEEVAAMEDEAVAHFVLAQEVLEMETMVATIAHIFKP